MFQRWIGFGRIYFLILKKKKKCCAKSYSNFISSGTILELNVKLDVETVKWNLFETWNVSVNYVNRCNSPWMRDYSVYFSSSIVSINVSKISCINCSILGARFHPAWFMSNHAWFCKEFSLKTKVWIIITNEFFKVSNEISCYLAFNYSFDISILLTFQSNEETYFSLYDDEILNINRIKKKEPNFFHWKW